MAREGAVRLPTTLTAAYRTELFRAFHSPYETPIVVLVNGVLMVALWFMTSSNIFFSVHATWAFPLVLSSWMYSDVPATNVFGSDAERMIKAMDDKVAMRRMLYAKNLVLMTLVIPIGAASAVVVGYHLHRPIVTFINIAWVVLAPLGALSLAGWFGVYFPYHPIPLQTRWQNRRPFFRMIVRWLAVAMVPYGLVPALAFLVALPALLVWDWKGGIDPTSSTTDVAYGLGTALASAIAVGLWFFGHHMTPRLAERRRAKLVAYLEDPSLG